MFQSAWAVDGMVAVHTVGSNRCSPKSTRNAGTREKPYRRVRPESGEAIDDIEACLSVVEDRSTRPLRELIAGAPITAERKGAVAQFLGVQLFRGPAFFDQHDELGESLMSQLEPQHLKSGVLAAHDGDIERVRAKMIDTYRDPTKRGFTMLTKAVKVASIFGLMRWQIVVFDDDLLAYSDHPVVLWPGGVQRLNAPPRRQALGPLSALEVRVPLSPSVALVMNWVDESDRTAVRLAPAAAGELNALTIGQADTEWMHKPGREPPVATGPFRPLSHLLDPGYDQATLRSTRRATAESFLHRHRHRTHVQDVVVVVDVSASPAT